MPIILVLCVAVTIVIAIHANRIAAEQAIVGADEQEGAGPSFEVTEAMLQQDAHPEINSLITRYFDAYASGNVEILRDGLYRTLDEVEAVTIEERAKYIEELRDVAVYTKPGPVEDSWIAYAYSNVRYIGCDEFLPGMVSFYICRDEDGAYYINADETTQSVKDYITTVNLQDDVVDLYNRVNVEYADRLQANPMFGELVAAIYAEIDESIGERLSGIESAEAAAEGEAQPAEAGAETGTEAPAQPREVRIRATTKVNVRASDSTESSVLGKAQAGEEFVRIAEQENGWSKISYAGGAGFVKSEFFEVVEEEQATAPAGDDEATSAATAASTEADASAGPAAAASQASTAASAQAPTAASGGTRKTTTKVRLRKGPNTASDIVATLEGGTSVEVRKERDDGWTEVVRGEDHGYIKSEYLAAE